MDDWDDIGENNSTSSSDAEDSNFKILTIADVEQLMSERIDYVKSVYPVSIIVFIRFCNRMVASEIMSKAKLIVFITLDKNLWLYL